MPKRDADEPTPSSTTPLTRTPRRILDDGFHYGFVAISPDSKALASVCGGYWNIKVWGVLGNRFKVRGTIKGHTEDNCKCICDHEAMMSTDYPEPNPSCTAGGHSGQVWSVDFSPDSKTLASASSDKTVKLWNASTMQLLRTLTGHSDPVESVAFSPDNKTLASGSRDRTVKLWDYVTGNLKDTLTGHSDWVACVAFSRDRKTLASGSLDNTVKLWDVSGDKPKEKGTLRGHSSPLISIAFSPDNKTLATACNDWTVKLWDVSGDAPKEPKFTLENGTGEVLSVAFSHDNTTLAFVGRTTPVSVWDLSGGAPVERAILGEIKDCTENASVAFFGDNKTLVSTCETERVIKVWDVSEFLATGKGLPALRGKRAKRGPGLE